MRLYTFYADSHIGVPMQICSDLLTLTREMVLAKNAYSIGDNIELKNCDPKNLAELLRLYAQHKALFSERFISGNHDTAGYSNDYSLIIDKNILLIHGDIELWGREKAFDFRTEARGQGYGLIQKVLARRNGSISNSEGKALAQAAIEANCKTVVLGHVHPKARFDKVINGVRVICCVRGKNEIYM